MEIIGIVRQAWQAVRGQRALWFFGFFIAGAGGAGGGSSSGPGAGDGSLPGWLIPALVGAAVLALAALAMHVIAEAAAIEGVARTQAGERVSIRSGIAAGARPWRRVLGLKMLGGVVSILGGVTVASPWLLYALGWLSLPATIIAFAPLLIAAVPTAITGYLVYLFALRFVVLEGEGVLDSVTASVLFLRGRVRESMRLLVAQLVASMATQAASVVALIPGAVIGGALYLTAGLIPAIVGGAIASLPLLVIVTGAGGALRSSIWTCGFLTARGRI